MDNKSSDRKGIAHRTYVLLNDQQRWFRFTILMINISIDLLILLFIVSIVSFYNFIGLVATIFILIFVSYKLWYKSWAFGKNIGKTIGKRLASNVNTGNESSINSKIHRLWKKFVGEAYPNPLIDYLSKLKDKNFYKPNRKDNILFILLLIVTTSVLYIPIVIDGVIQHYEQSGYFKKLSDSIVDGDGNDYSKVISLIDWQKHNITNIWGIDKSISIFYPPNVGLWYARFPPQIVIRPGDLNTANWALISRYGMCGEESQAFMKLVNQEDIPVRSIKLVGADHAFDEVFIDGGWRTVDITNGMNDSYNIPYGFYEQPQSQGGWGYTIAYAYAIYPNGTKEVVTNRYTQLSNITITVLDINNNPASNVAVKVYCDNNNNKKSTDISNNTTALGMTAFTLGDGKYVFEANSGAYTGSEDITLNPNTNNNLVIKLDAPIQKNIFNLERLQNNIALTQILILIISIIASYIVVLLVKFRDNQWVYRILFGVLAYTIIDVIACLLILYVST